MKSVLKRIPREDRGVLTFEWILLITVIIIGIVGGLSAVRDGVIDELGDVTEATIRIDQSWSVEPSECLDVDHDFGSFEDDEDPEVIRQRHEEPEPPPPFWPF